MQWLSLLRLIARTELIVKAELEDLILWVDDPATILSTVLISGTARGTKAACNIIQSVK